MAAETTRHVLFFGLEVKNEALYQRYRGAMTPILKAYGGSFGYDFVVSHVLKSETDASINRVFTILFPEQSAAERFFADSAYRAVRAELFAPAVGDVTRIGAWTEERRA